jgi:hypothetical protein
MSSEARPEWLTQRHWQLVEPVLEGILERMRVLAVYLTGSLAVRLGTRLSDVDLVVIVDDEDTARRPDTDYPGDGLICDVQTVSAGALAAWTADINGFSATTTDYDRVFSNRQQLRDLTRLFIGRAILGAEWLAAARDRVDQGRFRSCYTTLHLADAATFTRDTPGFLDANDLETAWETSARALRTAAEAALGACGNVNYSGKFLVRRLLDEPCARLVADSIRDLLYGRTPHWEDKADVVAVIEDRLGWTDRLSTEIFFRSLNSYLDTDPLRCDRPRRSGCPAHASGNLILRTEDGVTLLGSRPTRLDRPAGLLWCMIDGSRTESDLVRDFAKATSLSEDSVRTWVKRQVHTFAQLSLLA